MRDGEAPRNTRMAARIASAPVHRPVSFVMAGDSGAWPDPTADAIFSSLVAKVRHLDPAPAFFANLGDFAGPGTRDRHAAYLELVAKLPVPDICVIGNHDLDDAEGPAAWAAVHGPTNYDFACGDFRFVVIDGAPGEVGELAVATPSGTVAGPREAALAFLERTLASAGEPHRVVLTHAPPHLGGHYAPHA